jgi:hypothetical protein
LVEELYVQTGPGIDWKLYMPAGRTKNLLVEEGRIQVGRVGDYLVEELYIQIDQGEDWLTDYVGTPEEGLL